KGLKGKELVDNAVYTAQIDRWFSPLDRTPRDVPKLMSLYDYFYCKVLGGTAPALVPNAKESPEYQRAELEKAAWRPAWYEEEGPRGRSKTNTKKDATTYPGLITKDFTIPFGGPLMRCGLDVSDMETEDRKRGWDMYSIQPKDMNADFKQSLE